MWELCRKQRLSLFSVAWTQDCREFSPCCYWMNEQVDALKHFKHNNFKCVCLFRNRTNDIKLFLPLGRPQFLSPLLPCWLSLNLSLHIPHPRFVPIRFFSSLPLCLEAALSRAVAERRHSSSSSVTPLCPSFQGTLMKCVTMWTNYLPDHLPICDSFSYFETLQG